jgi:hypothetical protein
MVSVRIGPTSMIIFRRANYQVGDSSSLAGASYGALPSTVRSGRRHWRARPVQSLSLLALRLLLRPPPPSFLPMRNTYQHRKAR